MNIKIKSILAAAALALAFSGSAMALPLVSGGVDIGGSFTTDTGKLSDASAFDSFSYTSVSGGTGYGIFAGLWSGNSTAEMFAFSFDPLTAPSPTIWEITTATNIFTFDLTNVTIEAQGVTTDNAFLRLAGGGVLSGYENVGGVKGDKSHTDTNGAWTFNAVRANETDIPLGQDEIIFSFSSNTVPEPKSLAMLGLALLAFGATRVARKA